MDDERLAKGTEEVASAKASRRSRDREVTQDREFTDAERLELFRNTINTNALPDLPVMPGYHMCWLSTTNRQHSIHKCIRLGYELLRADMVPGMEHAALGDGPYEGLIGIEEMLAARLPNSLYQSYMMEAHHNAPRAEEEKLQRTVDTIREQAESAGAQVAEYDGTTELRRSAPSPNMFT